MTTKKISKITSDIITVAHNPAIMKRRIMRTLREIDDDEEGQLELNNPTDPVSWCAEMAVLLGHATIEASRAELPKQYPLLATSEQEIYKHMSDKDYIDVFAQPSSAKFILLLDKQDVIDKAIEEDRLGNKRLIIPADTFITVAGYTFTLQYPIIIRILGYGGLQVLWDTSIDSPIGTVESDSLDWTQTRIPGADRTLLRIEIPALQYNIKSHTDVIVPSLGWRSSFTFVDQFFCARVYVYRDSTWEEIRVTFANDVYDTRVPTAVLEVVGKKLNVYIPEVYINSGLVSGSIRVDIHDTLGPLSVILGNYPVESYALNVRDIGGNINQKYYNPFKTLSLLTVLSEGSTIGGRRGLKFDELRDRVITNSVGVRRLPITEKQVAAAAGNLGMEISKPIDYVTGRIYTASVGMLASSIKEVCSSIGTASLPLDFTMGELETLPTVRDNGKRKTICPETVYSINETKLAINKELTVGWQSLRTQDLVNIGNMQNLYYTPFYYVVDTNGGTLDVRAYNLAAPKVVSKRFVDSNETTEVDVVSKNMTIERRDTGYVLTVVCRSEKTYKELSDSQCFTQLSFVPRGYNDETDVAYVDGVLVGYLDDERVWEFNLGTNLDIDRNNDMIMNNFKMDNVSSTLIPMRLTGDFNIFYGTKEYYPANYKRANMDSIIVAPTADAYGVTHEVIKLTFGDALTLMWCKSKALTGSISYEHHHEDVPYYYPRDIYKVDPDTDVRVYEIDMSTTPPTITFEYEHRKGDPKYKPDGELDIQYTKGSVVFDEAGNPVIKNRRQIKYRTEMSVFDARYLFSNTEETVAYRDAVRTQVADVVTTTIPTFAADLLERTTLYFKPKTTISNIEIRRDDGSTDFIPAECQFSVRYYLTAQARGNNELISDLQKTTRSVISSWLLTHKTVSVSDLTQELKTRLGDSVISVEIDKMGPSMDLRIFTVLTEASHASIAKKLTVEADGSIGLRDDIIISYVRHDQEK